MGGLSRPGTAKSVGSVARVSSPAGRGPPDPRSLQSVGVENTIGKDYLDAVLSSREEARKVKSLVLDAYQISRKRRDAYVVAQYGLLGATCRGGSSE